MTRQEFDKAHRAAVVERMAAAVGRLTDRPCPPLRCHKGTGQAFAAWKVGGLRRYVYFGPHGTREAETAYRRFMSEWPEPLFNDGPKARRPEPRMLTLDGRTQPLREWARELGMRAGTLTYRLDVLNWPVRKALTVPVAPRRNLKWSVRRILGSAG